MALMTCAGADVLRGRIHMPLRGVWWADLVLDTAQLPAGQVTFNAAGGISLTGTIVNGGIRLDSAHIRIYGGGGGSATVLSGSAYQNAVVNDVLNAIVSAAGERASSTIAANISSAQLQFWTISIETAAHALDNLAGVAGRAVGQQVNWRVLADGAIWMGVETYPSQSLPTTSDVLDVAPVGPRYEIGCETPTLLPGINLTDVGANISGVDHWLSPDRIRTWAWT